MASTSKTAHTPGPWEVLDSEIIAGGSVIAQIMFSQDLPCFEGDEDELDAECNANAGLIIAAPDMLAALLNVRGLYASLVGPDDAIAQVMLAEIDAAIAKAEGR